MSAYLMNVTDFADLARYYWNPANSVGGRPSSSFINTHTCERFECGDADLALKLATENIASVSYRYQDHGQYGGFLDEDNETGESVATFMGEIVTAFRNQARLLTHAQAWDMARTLDYQSCEHFTYRDSEGYAILQAIKHKAGCGMAAEAHVSETVGTCAACGAYWGKEFLKHSICADCREINAA